MNDSTKESYSLRNIFISGVFCSLILSGSIISLSAWNSFIGHEHLPPIFNATELTFTVACCFISYLLATILVFYLKDSLKKFINSWLIVSLSGSIIFSVLLAICDYINKTIEIRNYRKPLIWASGDLGRPELPTLENLILFILLMSIAGFVNTSLVYSLFRSFHELLPVRKNKYRSSTNI